MGLPRPLADLPITDWPFLVGLGVAGLAAVAVLVVAIRRRGWPTRVVAGLAVVVLVLINAAAGLNTYVDFDRTLGEAVGQVPPDEVPLANLLRRIAVPASGIVAPVAIPTKVSGFVARPALIYVPPAWFRRPRPRLPVIVLLHGTPGGPDVWFGAGQATATADAWATAHRGVAPIIVAPDVNGSIDADSECVDSPAGRVETALTVDLPRFVQSTFRTLPPGPAWAVAGFSEGGSCALMLALRHPTLFGTVGDYGGLAGPRLGDTNADTASTLADLFGGSTAQFAAHEPADLLARARFARLGGWFEVGDADPEPAAAQAALAPAARRAGIATCSVVIPGGAHTFDVFSAGFADSLPWLAGRLGIGPARVPCPQQ
ncbi:esterase family protein [Actinomycetospora endophytica]|uniref:Esterase family protein n=1 Tax=Actinomycetospora endophytica TaxID=2291215 RepID=A0ABS8P510_9PSEU|nr:alpha/beta hydrolase-fold protein [Actinomycetospora endophytica]MCD2193334.1 esterase family protein [Actinomycetospora endophytica]